MTTTWTMLHPKMTRAHLGYLPGFLSEADPRPAKEQIDENYAHGGGWRPFGSWKLDPRTLTLRYPGDPPMRPLAVTRLHNEHIYFYEHAMLLILQADGSFEVARVD